MAKQSKKAIDQRKAELITAGYTEEELSRPDILESIENTTAGNWPGVAEGLKKTKEDSLIPLIEAEHIPNKPAGEAKGPGTTMVVTMDVTKDVAALTFDTNKEAIELWVKTYASLKFTNLEDVDTITKIREGKKLAQKCRIAVTKRETFLKAPYIAGSKKIKEVADEYVALLAKIEDPLDVQIELIKKAEEADKIKKAEEAEAEGTRRVEVLKAAGIKFDGQFYCIGETISMDYASLKAKTPEDFDKFVILVQNEKTRLDDLAADELKQLKAQRFEVRSGLLKTLGYATDENDKHFVIHGSDLFPVVMIEMLTDEEDGKFMTFFNNVSQRVAKAKQDKIDEDNKKAKERTVNMRSKLIIAAGLNRVDWIPGTTQTGFYFKNDFIECRLPLPLVETQTDEEFDATLEVMEKQIIEAKAQAVKKEDEDKATELLAKDRREQLVALGMTAAPKMSCYIFNLHDATTQCSVAYGELTGKSPEAWETVIVEVTELIQTIKDQQQAFEDKRAKDKKDKEDKDAKDLATFTSRQYKLVNLGMVIVGNVFTVKNEFGDNATISIDEVKVTDEDAWPRRLTEMTTSVEDVKKKTTERRNAAIAKVEAMKPEIQRAEEAINAAWDAIKDISPSNFTDNDVACRYGNFYDVVYKAVNEGLGSLGNLKK